MAQDDKPTCERVVWISGGLDLGENKLVTLRC